MEILYFKWCTFKNLMFSDTQVHGNYIKLKCSLNWYKMCIFFYVELKYIFICNFSVLTECTNMYLW